MRVAYLLLIVLAATSCHSVRDRVALDAAGNPIQTRGQAALQPGTWGGNPELSALVTLQFSEYNEGGNGSSQEFVSELTLCVKRLRLKGYDPKGELRYPSADLKIGEVKLSPDGTILDQIRLPEGIYTQAELEITNECPSGLSVLVTNGYGTFSSKERIHVRFPGLFIVDSQDPVLSLRTQLLIRRLKNVRNDAEIRTALEQWYR